LTETFRQEHRFFLLSALFSFDGALRDASIERERWWRRTQTGTEHRSRANQSRSIVCASEEGGLRRSLERRYLYLLRRDVFDWIEGSSGGGRRF
jgi:hypothetical protein